MKTSNSQSSKQGEKPNASGKVKSDFPKHTLDEALRVARALTDKNGGQPLPPTETAIAIGVSPGSSEFRMLLSSSIKYGLTSGSYNTERVSIDEVGRNIVEPISHDHERRAMGQAALTPPTFRKAYDYFKGKKLPDDVFFQNTLVREFEVPREHAAKCASVFIKNMERIGMIRSASTGKWLSTEMVAAGGPPAKEEPNEEGGPFNAEPPAASIGGFPGVEPPTSPQPRNPTVTDPRLGRVFITHGKNTAFINPIKDLLSFGQMEPVVAVERESVAQPVPDKVMSDMRSCGAAIIHIDAEQRLMDGAAKEHIVLNPNVLIEIGAAMALYGQRFILLVRDGLNLPSNMQGLYQVRYEGEKLDGEVTIRLLKAIAELKSKHLPTA